MQAVRALAQLANVLRRWTALGEGDALRPLTDTSLPTHG
jgi:hypothetical protein